MKLKVSAFCHDRPHNARFTASFVGDTFNEANSAMESWLTIFKSKGYFIAGTTIHPWHGISYFTIDEQD